MQTSALPTEQNNQQTPYFYAVGLPKFATMWLGTAGFYGLYWFHQHWQTIRDREHGDFKPWHRMLLAGSYCEPLLAQFVAASADVVGVKPIRPRLRAIAWLAMTATLVLGPPLSLVCPFAFLPLLEAQRLANQVNVLRTPKASTNARINRLEALAFLPVFLTLLAGLAWRVGRTGGSIH